MKIPIKFLAIVALAVFLAFASGHSPPVSASSDSDLSFQSQDDRSSPVTAAPVAAITAAEVRSYEDCVLPSVGKMLLNSKRVQFVPVQELEGYRTVIAKPKISNYQPIRTRYNGLGHDHFARADV